MEGFFFSFFFLGYGYFIVNVPNKLGFSQVDQISSFAFSQVDLAEITSSAAEDINHSWEFVHYHIFSEDGMPIFNYWIH